MLGDLASPTAMALVRWDGTSTFRPLSTDEPQSPCVGAHPEPDEVVIVENRDRHVGVTTLRRPIAPYTPEPQRTKDIGD